MEQEFFNSFDSWEVISLIVSFVVVSVAIYRWLIVRWQSDVNLKKYVFVHGVPNQVLDASFEAALEVPHDQHVVIALSKDDRVLRTIYEGTLTKGLHHMEVDCRGFDKGIYQLKVNSEGQVDIKIFKWSGD